MFLSFFHSVLLKPPRRQGKTCSKAWQQVDSNAMSAMSDKICPKCFDWSSCITGHTIGRKKHGPFHTHYWLPLEKWPAAAKRQQRHVTHLSSWTTLWCLIQGANAMTFWLMVTVSGYLFVARLSRHFCHKTAGGRMDGPATSCNNFYCGIFSVMAMLPCKNHRRFRAEAWGNVSIYGWISLISSVPVPCTKWSPNWISGQWMLSMAFSDLHTLHSCEP